jgi:microcystin-dependent protein
MALYKYNSTTNKLVPLTSEGNVGLPVGAVLSFPAGTTQAGWLLCDGSTFDRTVYPALYTYLGNSNVLPDYRECVLVGAGQNDTDTIAVHDVYDLGEFKDDQLQGHGHTFQQEGGNPPSGVPINSNVIFGGSQTSAQYNTNAVQSTSVIDARYGTTTHGKQKGVAYYIKATSAGPEVEPDIYATKGMVRDAVSYSTDEQPTGGTWIDGKQIYKITKEGTANFSNDYWTDITLFNDNVQKKVVKLDMICETVCLRPQYLTITNKITFSPSNGSGNGTSVSNGKYVLTVYYTKATD